jgi:hypothetical protein
MTYGSICALTQLFQLLEGARVSLIHVEGRRFCVEGLYAYGAEDVVGLS